jgi:hypothetical protein
MRFDTAGDTVSEMTGLPSLPFPAEVEVCAAPDSSQLLVIEARPLQPGKDLEMLKEVVSYFMAAAEAGIFASPPGMSELTHSVARSASVSQTGFVGTYELSHVPPQAFKILLGMIVQSHFGHVGLAALRISVVSGPASRWNLSQILARGYPDRVPLTQFDLDLASDLEDAQMSTVRLRFARALTEQEFSALEERIADWHCLMLLGGYANSFEKMKGVPVRPKPTYLLSPSIVEHGLYGSPGLAAYDGMVNLAVKLDAAFCPLLALEIE